MTFECRHTTNLSKIMMVELMERTQFQKAEMELKDLQLRKRCHLHRDNDQQSTSCRDLRLLRIDGKAVTDGQIDARPEIDVVGYSLCSEDERHDYNPEEGFRN
ncbi:hypothetical protein NECAME_03857 [Necator americanus]|uniref:Uncharacterized protein n=1 Tax=Necator americanus TaxID=51031 RepID=W2T0P3_NECAM|nr:hypothetical protein NECAME_03857 [Necator americanus]ETN75134.1 hypothetical protein NECAME_03857 [Necator americanus]